jgi:hypothetical protein
VKKTRPRLTIAVLALALVACSPGTNNHPVPSVAQIGSDLHCASGDHGFEDGQAGWGFCYPATWKYQERAQDTVSPPGGLELAFGITDIPCTSPPAGASVRPSCLPGAGLFAYMIVSTYFRGDSPNLAAWVQTNLNPQATPTPTSSPSPGSTPSPSPLSTPTPTPSPTVLRPIQWGNATEAGVMADGRRIALTPSLVVILELRSGQGLLDLETPMSARLNTWKFLA